MEYLIIIVVVFFVGFYIGRNNPSKIEIKEDLNEHFIKSNISTFFNYSLNQPQILNLIHDLKITTIDNKVDIIIYTPVPGLIIGRYGQTITRLKDHLSSSELIVEIKLIEKSVF